MLHLASHELFVRAPSRKWLRDPHSPKTNTGLQGSKVPPPPPPTHTHTHLRTLARVVDDVYSHIHYFFSSLLRPFSYEKTKSIASLAILNTSVPILDSVEAKCLNRLAASILDLFGQCCLNLCII